MHFQCIKCLSETIATGILSGLGLIYIFRNFRSHHHHNHEIEAYYFHAGTIGWMGIFIVSAFYLMTIVVVLLFYLTFNEFREEINNHSSSPLLTLINGQYFLAVTLTIAFTGLIIAYWKEGLGGGISLASFIVLFIGWSDFHVNFIIGMVMASLPAILYFTYWLTVYLELKKAKRDQIKSP